ncbi:hypothetical protein CFP56_029177 [Quercus suber]|uniref:Uncharacterized protein n=1 Tax=Quercus suber TaxID=58331 RepID=A0AAW0MAP2_QUESU
MSEDAKRSIQGALAMKPLSYDDRKPSSAATAATPPIGKRVIIKSADLFLFLLGISGFIHLDPSN